MCVLGVLYRGSYAQIHNTTHHALLQLVLPTLVFVSVKGYISNHYVLY